jgi:hypothetical protein
MARRLAMNWAADIAGSQGAILTTDADGQVPSDWVARNLRWLDLGYDAVCGMATIDPEDEAKIPAHLLADDVAETNYTALLNEIDHLIDPNPWDSWPKHSQCSGASIAVRAAIYAAVGGLPAVNHSEDRGFIAKLEWRDCKIRHDVGIVVKVSGRTFGRAVGGMAETIARRIIKQDEWADERLEAPEAAVRRAELRRRARTVWKTSSGCCSLATSLLLPAAQVEHLLRSPWFGKAWSDLETLSPLLMRQPIAMGTLPEAIRQATPIIELLLKTTLDHGFKPESHNEETSFSSSLTLG